METNFQKLKLILTESNLLQEEQNNLLVFLSLATDEELETTVKLFMEDPTLIEKINRNYKEKQKIIKANDSEKWQKIIEEEEKDLKEIEAEKT